MANKELADAGLALISQNLGPEETVELMFKTTDPEVWQTFLSGMTRQSDLSPHAKEVVRRLLSWHLEQSGLHAWGVDLKPEILIAFLFHHIFGLSSKIILEQRPQNLPPSVSRMDNLFNRVQSRLRAYLPNIIAEFKPHDPQTPHPPQLV